MVNESLTIRLAKERLAAIKQFIPIRDRLRKQLQMRQEQKDDFSAIPRGDTEFKRLYDLVKQQSKQPPSYLTSQLSPQQKDVVIPDEIDIRTRDDGATGTSKKKNGKGYLGSGVVGSASITCPGKILSDISRLEILIGGRRAGNNSPEIINEAADICARLFRGGIMDVGVYRELVDELMDDYHSDKTVGSMDLGWVFHNLKTVSCYKMIIHCNHDKPVSVYVVNSRLPVYRAFYGNGLGDTIAGLFARMAPKVAPLAKQL
ncbi:hypothetical protein ACJMK2_033067 [Sinanodonta woodiana]|uniref:Uncharacterized protein n=1 Tax=Sinanodonta woodiana TaxID=1069815 RepID=A0ABD3X585_SINWO